MTSSKMMLPNQTKNNRSRKSQNLHVTEKSYPIHIQLCRRDKTRAFLLLKLMAALKIFRKKFADWTNNWKGGVK